jgi:hypothetical protein
MQLKVWILLVIAGILLLLRARRERFDATATIKNPSTWDAAEYTRIRKLVNPESTLDDTEIQRVVGGFWSYALPSSLPNEPAIQKGWSVEETRIQTSDLVAYLDQMYRTNVITDTAKRPKFQALLKAYYIDQGQSEFQRAAGYTGPTGGTQATGGTAATGASTGTVERPSSASADLRQEIATTAGIPTNDTTQIGYFLTQVQKFYDTVYLPAKQTPTSAQFTAFADAVDTSAYPSGIRNNFKVHLVEILETYFETAPRTADQGTPASPGGGAAAQMGGGAPTTPTPQSPGPGASSSAAAPTTGTGAAQVQGFQLFGPRFTEYGTPLSGLGLNGAGGAEASQFPELLGGREKGGPGAARAAGGAGAAGGTGPMLPPSSSLGTDLGSMFFPFSRTPGDMDLVPDPFRAMNNFSLASYTPKTDPVPFLPDFSAFQS